MRRLYTLLLYLALPLATLLVLLRGVRQPEYWRGAGARFGFGARRQGGGLWVHAVSVGEVQAASILVLALRARQPTLEVTLTCATPTGRARARALLPSVDVRYAPYDLPGCIRRCLARLRPVLLIVFEAELWPNLLHQMRRAGVPTLLASARVSARSASIFQSLPGLLRDSLAGDVWAGAQSLDDAQRLRSLGLKPHNTLVVGNIKFDRSVAPELSAHGAQLRACYAAARPVWVAGSTHAGEESILLQAHARLREIEPAALLILAPRYPQRFEAVASAVQALGMQCARRSRDRSAAGHEVLLLDTLGELAEFYAAADVAFVGGSLVRVGGHNLLEPAAVGVPVLSGPQQFNSPDIARVLQRQGALTIVHDAAQLTRALAALLADPAARARQGAAGRAAVAANRGALQRLLALIDALPGAPLQASA